MEKVAAHITGTISRVERQVGDAVKAGDVVVTLESMKMEIPVLSEATGTVLDLAVAEGDVVQEGDLIAVIG